MSEINLCPHCNCMTKTKDGKCGKCGGETMSEIERVIERFKEISNQSYQWCSCYEGDLNDIFQQQQSKVEAFLRQELTAIVEKCCKIVKKDLNKICTDMCPEWHEGYNEACKTIEKQIRKELLEDK